MSHDRRLGLVLGAGVARGWAHIGVLQWFEEHRIPIDDYTRGQGLQVLTIIDRAVEMGFLAAAPAERACTWCDFRSVCGPREEERTARKAQDKLADLKALRSMR